ncbi:uncharacterized protein LOC128224213 isoform X2 [Mya arenaria]|uniref:uncharacterized protein LOC128224213 isoform X2 n=1 Tax=Mya arenaria TaxID=6604 RepID=UPI0022E8155D|nr:uncharacterized protein LOC128224213 isoform X2 [Mya arenaria]
MDYKFVFSVLCLTTLYQLCYGLQNRKQRTSNDDFVISITTDGTYSINIHGKSWLNSAPTFFNANNKTYSAADKTLNLTSTSATSGTDKLGQWQSTSFDYVINDAGKTRFTAVIKTYPSLPVIIFQQVYTDGAKWTQGKTYEDLCGGFPGFQLEGPPGLLGFLSFGGLMFGDTSKKIGLWSNATYRLNDGITGGPLALFDSDGRTLVLSPFNNFMSASFLHDAGIGGNYYGGIMGGVSSVPMGYTQEFILYYDTGINKAFEGWGKLMRTFYGKDPARQQEDMTIKYLGYYTDNGAYYYYNTEKNKTYEQTMLDVRTYANNKTIPYKYVQYDSWWYYKGVDDGVKTWVSRPDVFPDGFLNVSRMMGLPAAAHNRYWASDTTYAKQNGGTYDFIVEKSKALPVTKKFWDDLFNEAKKWGLVMYEQDWLNVEFSGVQALLHNLTLGTTWLDQMATAADDAGIFIQYCMANPRHAMQALMYPRVTQGRVSNDYSPGDGQWSIGISSIFATALGIAPFKDTFWTTETQPGNIYKRTEPNWKLNMVVSTLSTGPVGPSDMVGATNVSMLMKCCRSDGVILKPQFPIRAIDAQILQAAFNDVDGPDGEAWLSYTQVGGLRFADILVLNLKSPYTLYPRDTGIYDNVGLTDLYAVPYDDPFGWVTFSSLYGLQFDSRFTPSRIAFYHVSQAIPGWFETAILGELDKWAPMSPQRVTSLTWTSSTVTSELVGAPFEQFDFWYILGSKQNAVTCKLGATGAATFMLDNDLGIATCKP